MSAVASALDLAASAQRIRAARAALACQSSEKFAAYVLKDEATCAPIRMGAIHRQFHRATDTHDRVVWQAFINSGKTSQLVAKVLHVLGTRPSARILYV